MTNEIAVVDQETADKAVDALCAWLKNGASGAGITEGVYDSIAATVARSICTKLLESSDADDHGGCPLCCS